MTEPEAEKLVADTVRRYAGEGVRMDARFAEDLRMGEMTRQMLFAHLAESFNARGVSLPGRGFYLRDFMACKSPAEVESTIRSRILTSPKAKGGHGAGHGSAAAAETQKAEEPKKSPEEQPAATKPPAEVKPAAVVAAASVGPQPPPLPKMPAQTPPPPVERMILVAPPPEPEDWAAELAAPEATAPDPYLAATPDPYLAATPDPYLADDPAPAAPSPAAKASDPYLADHPDPYLADAPAPAAPAAAQSPSPTVADQSTESPAAEPEQFETTEKKTRRAATPRAKKAPAKKPAARKPAAPRKTTTATGGKRKGRAAAADVAMPAAGDTPAQSLPTSVTEFEGDGFLP